MLSIVLYVCLTVGWVGLAGIAWRRGRVPWAVLGAMTALNNLRVTLRLAFLEGYDVGRVGGYIVDTDSIHVFVPLVLAGMALVFWEELSG